MSDKTKRTLALSGIVVVLICQLVALLERAFFATSPAFLIGFAVISALGFWAMSLHPLGR